MAAGGTGGHIYPALTLAEALIKRGHEVTFIGSNDRMEKEVIPASGYEYIGMDVLTTRGGAVQKARSVLSILKAYRTCLKILKGYDMAIGFGNYISIPVMLAAAKLHLKTVIGSYEENRSQFRNPNLKILGNPQSSKAYLVEKDPNVLKQMGLDPGRKTVVIFMGSLGSSTVNEKLLDYFRLFDGSYQIVYATGASHYEKMRSLIADSDSLKLFERIDGVRVMKNADLLVCRAGATTLTEICAMGMPSILIPSPFVPNNHQYYNGKALTDRDAAIMIEEKDLSGELLARTVKELIFDDERLHTLSENARSMGNIHVLDDMIEAIENV